MNTDVILCIIALSAIVSPVLVAFLNNQHDYAIKKLDMIIKTKQEVLSDFASSAISNWGDIGVSTKFYNALNRLYIYFDVNEKLVKSITENKHNNIYEYQKDVAKLLKDLSKQI